TPQDRTGRPGRQARPGPGVLHGLATTRPDRRPTHHHPPAPRHTPRHTKPPRTAGHHPPAPHRPGPQRPPPPARPAPAPPPPGLRVADPPAPHGRRTGLTAYTTSSRASADYTTGRPGAWPVTQDPARLWDRVETAWAAWQHHHQPPRTRIGITAHPAQQYAWLDHPDSPTRWPLTPT